MAELEAAGATHEIITVPGALELPQALGNAIAAGRIGAKANSVGEQQPYDGVIALGCVIRGETYHFEIVCSEANHWLMDIAIRNNIALGNGVLTVENQEQAKVRAEGGRDSKGADAARACLRLIEIARVFRDSTEKV